MPDIKTSCIHNVGTSDALMWWTSVNVTDNFLGRLDGRQLVVAELLAELRLKQLAGCGVRQLVDKHRVVGHPPLRDLAFEEPEQLVARHVATPLPDNDKHWPLLPFRTRHR